MNGEAFVSALKVAVRDSASSSVRALLMEVRGRNPDPALVALSEWYRGLPQHDRRRVDDVIAETARTSLFGPCAMLDHVRAFDERPHGRLERFYVKDQERTLVNDPKQEQLLDFVGTDVRE